MLLDCTDRNEKWYCQHGMIVTDSNVPVFGQCNGGRLVTNGEKSSSAHHELTTANTTHNWRECAGCSSVDGAGQTRAHTHTHTYTHTHAKKVQKKTTTPFVSVWSPTTVLEMALCCWNEKWYCQHGMIVTDQ